MVTVWESLTEGFAEAAWTEHVFWERQKRPQETDAWEEMGSLMIRSVAGTDWNRRLMKKEWIAVIVAFSGSRAAHSVIDAAVSRLLAFQSSCHFPERVMVCPVYAIEYCKAVLGSAR